MAARPNRNIKRIRDYGYQVAISRKSEVHTKFFGFSVYGSEEETLAAAREYRDLIEGALPETHSGIQTATLVNMPGFRIVEVDSNYGRQILFLVNFSDKPEDKRLKKISVEGRGFEDALKEASMALCDLNKKSRKYWKTYYDLLEIRARERVAYYLNKREKK